MLKNDIQLRDDLHSGLLSAGESEVSFSWVGSLKRNQSTFSEPEKPSSHSSRKSEWACTVTSRIDNRPETSHDFFFYPCCIYQNARRHYFRLRGL